MGRVNEDKDEEWVVEHQTWVAEVRTRVVEEHTRVVEEHSLVADPHIRATKPRTKDRAMSMASHFRTSLVRWKKENKPRT